MKNSLLTYLGVCRYGGKDQRAINRHVSRTYTVNGVTFCIDKCIDVYPRYYEIFRIPDDNYKGIVKRILVDDKELWGDGLSWTAAENLAYTAIQEYLSEAQL